MGIKSRGVQDANLTLIQYLRNNAPGLVAVKTEVVTVEGGTLTFEQENLSLRVRRGESVHNAMGKAWVAARPWIQENSNWTEEEEE